MTFRERLAKEHPDCIDPHCGGGCQGCPHDYGYTHETCPYDGVNYRQEKCNACWDREIPISEEVNPIPWDKIREIIEDGMQKRDREIHLYFNPQAGLSVNFYPWPDAETLYEDYKKGRITANDFREKMGLPRVKNAENFMKRDMFEEE